MKQIRILIILTFLCFTLAGCESKIDDSIIFKEDFEHDMTTGTTYKFTGKSEHFGFETGKVFYDGNSRQLIISNFKLLKEIKNLDYFKLTLSFDEKDLYYAEYDDAEKKKRTIKDFLNSIVIGENGKLGDKDENGNIIGESDSFMETTKETFKNSIKKEIKYCIKENCKKEKIKMNYIEDRS